MFDSYEQVRFFLAIFVWFFTCLINSFLQKYLLQLHMSLAIDTLFTSPQLLFGFGRSSSVFKASQRFLSPDGRPHA